VSDDEAFDLLSNAYMYGAGKPVRLRLEESGNLIRLEVQDHGAGVPAADRNVFSSVSSRRKSVRVIVSAAWG
jgi:K+-sensing histidine kinase KdpD